MTKAHPHLLHPHPLNSQAGPRGWLSKVGIIRPKLPNALPFTPTSWNWLICLFYRQSIVPFCFCFFRVGKRWPVQWQPTQTSTQRASYSTWASTPRWWWWRAGPSDRSELYIFVQLDSYILRKSHISYPAVSLSVQLHSFSHSRPPTPLLAPYDKSSQYWFACFSPFMTILCCFQSFQCNEKMNTYSWTLLDVQWA